MPPRHAHIVERVLNRLKLRQLRLLVAVGKHGSIQNAARELNVSQPAATKMIKDLELDFDVQLFDRTNRGVVPTPFGETLIRHGKIIFAQVSNAAQELDDLGHGNSGRVVVGTLLAASSHLLPLAIGKLLQTRPKVRVKVVEGTNELLMPLLRSGEIDMVVGRLSTYRHRADLTQERLFDEPIHAIVGPEHPLVGRPALSFEDLRRYGWVVPPVETTLRRQLDQFFLQQDAYVPPQMVESVSYVTNRILAQSRNLDLIGIVPAQVAAQDIATGVLVRLNWTVPFGEGPVGVSYRQPGDLSPAGLALLAELRETAAAM